MIGVQSYWTETSFWKMTRGTAIIHTLSNALANVAFQKVNFVTDNKGAEIATALGWRYHKISTKLHDLCPVNLRHIWAMGKLYAIALQTEPFCHLDNDVLLFKPLPPRILDAQMFAQSKDKHLYYGSRSMQQAIKACLLGRLQLPYNTSIIGGQNVQLLHLYGVRSFGACRRFEGSDIDGTTISMAVEQSWLGSFAHKKGIKIEELLPLNFTDEDAEKVGFSHLIGRSKHRPEIQARCEARLSKDFPDEYRKFNSGWMRLLESGYLKVAA